MHNAKVVLRRQLRQFKILCLQQQNIHSQLATKRYSSHMYFYKWMLVQTITNTLLLQTGACPDHCPLAWHVRIDPPARMYPT